MNELIALFDSLSTGGFSIGASVFLIVLVIVYCTARNSPKLINLYTSSKFSSQANFELRLKRLDELINKLKSEGQDSESDVYKFISNERLSVIIEEFSGLRMSKNEFRAYFKLYSTGKVTSKRIKSAWKMLKVVNGELHDNSFWVDIAARLMIFFSVAMMLLSLCMYVYHDWVNWGGLSWLWYVLLGAEWMNYPRINLLFFAAVYFVQFFVVEYYIKRSIRYAKEIEKLVYSKDAMLND
jgi:hypothetical protein